MKKIFLALFVLVLLSLFTPIVKAQSAVSANTVTKSYTYDAVGRITAVNVLITFTADSLLSQATPAFTVSEYAGVDEAKYPIAFRLKTISTYGVPNRTIFLQGLFATTSDTVSIDTVCNSVANQTENDTLGVLTCNNLRAPLGYKVFIKDITADINSGTLELTFPIPAEGTFWKVGAEAQSRGKGL